MDNMPKNDFVTSTTGAIGVRIKMMVKVYHFDPYISPA